MARQRADHTDLRIALRDLTEPQVRKVIREDGTTSTHIAPSLLEQLAAAIATGGETARGGRRGAPLPISVDAADAMTKIQHQAATLHRQVTNLADPDPTPLIRAAASIVGRWTDPALVEWVAHQVQAWVTLIRGLLDPPRRLHLAAACPACGVRMVWREQDGEQVQVPALEVDGHRGCTCLACRHVWPTAHLEHLAAVLGCAPQVGVTAQEVDTHGDQAAS